MISSASDTLNQIYETNQMQKASLIAAKSHADWFQKLDEQKKDPKYSQDPSTFTHDVNSEFDNWKNKQLDQVSSGKAQAALEGHLESLRGSVLDDSIKFQAHVTGIKNITDTTQVFDANQNLVRAHPELLDKTLESQNRYVADNPVWQNEHLTDSVLQEQSRKLHDQALNGRVDQLQANPAVSLSQVKALHAELTDEAGRWKTGASPGQYDHAKENLESMMKTIGDRDHQVFFSDKASEFNRIRDGYGNSGKYTPETIKAATPNDPKLRETMLRDLDIATQAGNATIKMRSMPDPEIRANLADMQSKLGSAPNYDAAKGAYDAAYQAYSSRRASAKADPGGNALSESPMVGAQYQSLMSQGANASPADWQAWAKLSKTSQENMHPDIPAQILPKQMVDSLKQQLDTASTQPGGYAVQAATLEKYGTNFGSEWPMITNQLRKANALNDEQYVVSQFNPADQSKKLLAQDMLRASQQYGKESVKDGTMDKAARDEVRKGVINALEPFRSSLSGFQNRDEKYTSNVDAITSLTLYRQRNGSTDTAEDNVKAVLGNDYHFQGSYSIPKGTQYDPDKIQSSLSSVTSAIQDGKIPLRTPPNGLGLDDKQADAYHRSALRYKGQWVNTPDGKGVKLWDENQAVVRDKTGNPVAYSFDDLMNMTAPDNSSPFHEAFR